MNDIAELRAELAAAEATIANLRLQLGRPKARIWRGVGKLSPTQWAVLEALMEGGVWSQERLIARMEAASPLGRTRGISALRVAMFALRQIIQPAQIQSLFGVGYIMLPQDRDAIAARGAA